MTISRSSPLIFLHIPKCGGMSLFSALSETFGPQIADLYDDSQRSLGRARLKLMDTTKSVYCGHFSFGLHEWIGREASYVSFVRDPISRLKSLYGYCLPTFKGKFNLSRGVSLEEMHKRIDFPDFFLDFPACIKGDYSPEAFFASPSAELENGMVRRFSGKGLSPEPCTDADLERAKKNIETFFSFIGLTERYDESIARLAELYGIKGLREKKVNVSKTNKDLENDVVFSEELLTKIRSMNVYDISLYKWICDKFDSRAAFKTVKMIPVAKRRSSTTIPLWRSVGNASVRSIDLLTYGQKNLKKLNLHGVKLLKTRVTEQNTVALSLLYKPVGSKKQDEFIVVDSEHSAQDAVHLLKALTAALKALQKKTVK